MNTLKHILPLLLVCLLSACSSNRYAEDIIGTWALEMQNDEPVDDSNFLILQFKEDGSMTLSKMYGPAPSYKNRWIESEANQYRLSGRSLYMEGITGNKMKFHQKAYIKCIDSLHLSKKVQEYHVGNINQIATRGNYEQLFHRVDMNYPKPTGLWDVYKVNDKRFKGFRFDIKEDGTYELLIEINGKWEPKEDNNGTWFSYGNILCTNFFNDIFKEELSYENLCHCLHYELNGNVMTWKSDLPGVNSFIMKKVETE